jgi:predicted N-acetyltransferase YhbS
MRIRDERADDHDAIRAVVASAFAAAEHASGTEPRIVDALRARGELSVSLVADTGHGALVGHVAFSPVRVDGEDVGWFGLGPVAVHPTDQQRGVGRALIELGLSRLRAAGAKGCVVLGEPEYYGRFGFAAEPSLVYPDAPARYFQALCFDGALPAGRVAYSPAFSVS